MFALSASSSRIHFPFLPARVSFLMQFTPPMTSAHPRHYQQRSSASLNMARHHCAQSGSVKVLCPNSISNALCPFDLCSPLFSSPCGKAIATWLVGPSSWVRMERNLQRPCGVVAYCSQKGQGISTLIVSLVPSGSRFARPKPPQTTTVSLHLISSQGRSIQYKLPTNQKANFQAHRCSAL